jgi:pimeloyl-ACP methyl ester carboxylesterase
MFGGIGVGVLGVAGAGVVTDVLPGGPRVRRFLGMTGPAGTIPDVPAGPVVTTHLASKARSRDVTVNTMAPEGYTADELPKCVALHGRGGDAHWMIDLGVPKFLTAAVRAGVRPFAVISVDGGPDSYWVENKGDDPQRMLAEELGPIQAAFGISMGGFGALCLARRRRDLKAVAVASPALFETWSEAGARGAFASEQQWADNEPSRHTNDIAGVPIGVWCGTEDPFLDAAQSFASQAHPAQTSFTSGAHEDPYWLRVLPELITFIGGRL